MDSFASWSSHTGSDRKTQLYEHLAECRRQESTEAVLQRFQTLFITGDRYRDDLVWDALTQLVRSAEANREFKYTLNRCSHTLINPWYTQTQDHWAIPALVNLFDHIPPCTTHTPSVTRRIRELSQHFRTTEEFAALQRLAQLVDPPADATDPADLSLQPLAHQLHQYPFLYDSELVVTKDSDQAQRDHAQDLRQQREVALGVQLARYWAQVRTGGRFSNPTRLPDEELQTALRYYTGKVEGNRSHRDQAHMFRTYSRTARSFRDFKEEFLEYLLAPLAAADPRYYQNTFSRTLKTFVRDILTEFDDHPPKDYTIVSFCRQVLSFLVVKDRKNPIFRRFRQLIRDAGYTLTLGLLLRLVLFCTTMRHWLENRLAVLFKHHEQHPCYEVDWLIKALEHANVALITNFNHVGYSF